MRIMGGQENLNEVLERVGSTFRIQDWGLRFNRRLQKCLVFFMLNISEYPYTFQIRITGYPHSGKFPDIQ